MGYNSIMKKKLLLSFLIVLAHFHCHTSYVKACGLFSKEYRVHVMNQITRSDVTLRCQSKDDDLGYQHLAFNGDFNWRFCENFGLSTLFFCHIWWKQGQQAFDAFNRTMYFACVMGECRWSARREGIYWYSPIKRSWVKQYDWGSATQIH